MNLYTDKHDDIPWFKHLRTHCEGIFDSTEDKDMIRKLQIHGFGAFKGRSAMTNEPSSSKKVLPQVSAKSSIIFFNHTLRISGNNNTRSARMPHLSSIVLKQI